MKKETWDTTKNERIVMPSQQPITEVTGLEIQVRC